MGKFAVLALSYVTGFPLQFCFAKVAWGQFDCKNGLVITFKDLQNVNNLVFTNLISNVSWKSFKYDANKTTLIFIPETWISSEQTVSVCLSPSASLSFPTVSLKIVDQSIFELLHVCERTVEKVYRM